ncbi:hypothetical protein [Allorhizobium undicola]|uniref:hypothetical protein n=1 Tax=Allorhizobium undicola TaxID=78527 RepID=UPI000480B39B|nr:hypothetical protein [Allorhizobium undicola]
MTSFPTGLSASLTKKMPGYVLRSATLALLLGSVSVFAGCTTQKAEIPTLEADAVGDADTPVLNPQTATAYRDPLVSAQPPKAHQKAQAQKAHPASITTAQTAADVQTAGESAQHIAAPQIATQAEASASATPQAAAASIVPQNMPTRRFQATVASVFSVQTPAQPVDLDSATAKPQMPVTPTAEQPAMPQTRAPTKAEILAGLAPNPHKARQAVRPQQQAALQQYQHGNMMGAGVSPTLQTSIPTALPATSQAGAATPMEQIEGDPKAQHMTKDGFLKKFLANFRKN